MSNHEPIKAHQEVKINSNRSFGFFFSALFFVLSIFPAVVNHQPIRMWLIPISFLLSLIACFDPEKLAALNRLWFEFGMILNKIFSPLIMAILFFLVVTPMSFVLRLSGKELLLLKKNSEQSYWVYRSSKGPVSGSMKNQF